MEPFALKAVLKCQNRSAMSSIRWK